MIPCNGDYHFNVKECCSPAFRGGHPEHLLPHFRMIRSWWPRIRENVRKFCGIGGFWSGTIDHASTAVKR